MEKYKKEAEVRDLSCMEKRGGSPFFRKVAEEIKQNRHTNLKEEQEKRAKELRDSEARLQELELGII